MSGTDGQSLAGLKVLLVEDEYFLADDVQRLLQAEGAIMIGPAATSDAALDLLIDQAVDLVVLDINLRGVDVYSLADELVTRGTPFLFATGYDADHIPDRFRDIVYLQKPVDREALARAIARVNLQRPRDPSAD